MSEVVWPMGMDRDLSSRPLVFNPKGFLVAIIESDSACDMARTALMKSGFSPDDLRVYTSKQILEDHELYLEAQSKVRRLVASLTDDQATVELYFGSAREGRGALWVHAPKKQDASRAMRYLADHPVLHYRYFGADGDHDVHVRGGGAAP